MEAHVSAVATLVPFSPFGATNSDGTGTAGDIPVIGIETAVFVFTPHAFTGTKTIGRQCTIYTPAVEPDCAFAGSKRNLTGGGTTEPSLSNRNVSDIRDEAGQGRWDVHMDCLAESKMSVRWSQTHD